jgi:hypothetical protein
MLGAALGIILTPAFAVASAFSYPGGAEDLPFWAQWVKAVFPLDFASGSQVYFTYGRLYFLTLLPELWALHVLRGLRGGGLGTLEKWGFRLSLIGMWLVVMGVFTDYWTGTPPAFWAVFVGTPFLMASFVLLGVGLRRSGIVPRWAAFMMIGASVGTIPVILLIPHIPSGFLLSFHAAWVALGYVLWSGKGETVRERARVK